MAAVPLLLIDDDPDIVALVTRGLAPQYLCRAAHDGPTGLALAARERVAAVVLDIRLPGMDGLAVLAALRAERTGARLPVILFSSLSNQPSIQARIAPYTVTAPVLCVAKSAGVQGLRAALAQCVR